MVRLKRLLPVAGFAWLMFYFAYHAMTGDQGLRNLMIYQQREQVLGQRLVHLKHCRSSIETRISLLGDQSLDLDYLEERAHSILYLADPKDIVLPLGVGDGAGTQKKQDCSQG